MITRKCYVSVNQITVWHLLENVRARRTSARWISRHLWVLCLPLLSQEKIYFSHKTTWSVWGHIYCQQLAACATYLFGEKWCNSWEQAEYQRNYLSHRPFILLRVFISWRASESRKGIIHEKWWKTVETNFKCCLSVHVGNYTIIVPTKCTSFY
jgi:hypothetical protein